MSLIELVVVLAGCMILVLCSTQFVSVVQRVTARAELGLLALTIRTEQQTALLTGTERTIVFYPHNNAPVATEREARSRTAAEQYATATQLHTLARGVTFAAPPGALGSPADPRKPITKPITFVDSKLTCYPQGTMQAGTIYLAAPTYKQYYALTSSVACYAFLRLYQYRLNWSPL